MIFSIIIPVYNVEAYLRECLDSVLNQNVESCELICVDDGSTDGSLTILESYKVSYPAKVKVFSQPNAGLSVTRNKAIKEASGDYLFFLDSDDTLKEGSLARLAQEVEVENIDIITFNSELYFEKEHRSEPNTKFNHSEYQLYANGMDYFDAFVARRGWGPSAVCFYLFKRELLIKNNLNFEIGLLHEDELFMPQVLYYASGVKTLTETFYKYRIHGTSITGKQSDKNYLDKLKIAEMLYDFFCDKNTTNKSVKRSIYNLSLAGIHGLMNTYSGRKKISTSSKKIVLKVAGSRKERMLAFLINLNVRIYELYFKVIK